MTVLKIEKLPHNRILPEYKTEGAAGMDLCAAIEEPIELKPLERKLIPTGLKIELEHGFEAQIRPRSGMSIKHGITLINAVGTVDADYRGEIKVVLHNDSEYVREIKPGERVAQMIVMPYPKVSFIEVEELSDTVRGESGFGGTGRF